MSRKRNTMDPENPVVPTPKKRTRIVPIYTLKASHIKTGREETLVEVRGKDSAMAVFNFAVNYLSDTFEDFYFVKSAKPKNMDSLPIREA